jgi:hypothetical protein
MTLTYSYLKPGTLTSRETLVMREPYPFLVAHDILNEKEQETLAKDYPDLSEPGYLPYSAEECGPSVRKLIEELTSPEVADALGDMLGIPHLSQYPTMVQVCRLMNRRHGTIHTDSRSKVATALLYLNESWDKTSAGCLRFLDGSDDIDHMLVPEVKPLFGNFAMFKRTDNSFHGHLPYEGERRVIQIAWIVNHDELDPKVRRGRFSRWVKSIFKETDRKLGADRGRNAAHLK